MLALDKAGARLLPLSRIVGADGHGDKGAELESQRARPSAPVPPTYAPCGC